MMTMRVQVAGEDESYRLAGSSFSYHWLVGV